MGCGRCCRRVRYGVDGDGVWVWVFVKVVVDCVGVVVGAVGGEYLYT